MRNRCVLIAAALLAACGTGAAADSGVTGTVSVAPTCPGPQHAGQSCSGPLAGAHVRLSDDAGNVAGSATTSATGAFTIQALPGHYTLAVIVGGLFPRCAEQQVTLPPKQVITINISCDSGIR